MMPFGTRKELRATFDQTLARVPEALKAEGFGVLTEIDVQKTLDQKLGVPFRRYKILGACNPPFAYEALQAELEVGLLLPCNVVVYENDDRTTTVLAVDPTKTVTLAGSPALEKLAVNVKERLDRALARLE